MTVVLDASALLAFLHDEPGAEVAARAIRGNAVIGTANLAEALGKVADAGADPRAFALELASRGMLGGPLRVEPLTEDDAVVIAELRPRTRHVGFSLADRACLALAMRLGLPVVTADRAWATLDLGVDVQLIR